MKQADRDKALARRICDDARTLELRITHFSMTEERFCHDRSFEGELAYDAIMNPVYRIAEDAIHLSDETQRACPTIPWRNIKSFRNFVAHGYSQIDRNIAWKVVTEDIPSLADALKSLANGNGDTLL